MALPGACRVRCCAETTHRFRGAIHTTANRATLAEERSGAALPATKQAVGAPSAWSKFFPVSFARPRRWCDAGPPPKWRRTRRPGLKDVGSREKPHAYRRVPRSLGGAYPSVATLKVGPAPPYRQSGRQETRNTSHAPARPTVSRMRESNRLESEGQPGLPQERDRPSARSRHGSIIAVARDCPLKRCWARSASRSAGFSFPTSV